MTVKPRTFVYKTSQSCAIRADVYLPPHATAAPPVLVYIHGGALIFGSRHEVRMQHLDRYLDAGLAVVTIDYRLAPQVKLPAIVEDVCDAFGWIHRRQGDLGVDASRMGVVGHSAGGYLTLCVGQRSHPPTASACGLLRLRRHLRRLVCHAR